jgi:hypothetical protein
MQTDRLNVFNFVIHFKSPLYKYKAVKQLSLNKENNKQKKTLIID